MLADDVPAASGPVGTSALEQAMKDLLDSTKVGGPDAADTSAQTTDPQLTSELLAGWARPRYCVHI